MPDEPASTQVATDQVPEQSSTKSRITRRGLFMSVVGIVIVVAIAAGAYFLGQHSHKQVTSSSAPKSVSNTPVNASSSTSQSLPPAEFLSGNTYYSAPKKLPDLGFIKDYSGLFGCETDCVNNLSIDYYQIGTTSDNYPIIDMTYFNGPGSAANLIAIKMGDNEYHLLAQNDPDVADSTNLWLEALNSTNPIVAIEYQKKLDDIQLPLTATVANQKMKVEYAPDGAKSIGIGSLDLMPDGLASIRDGSLGGKDIKTAAIKKLGSQNKTDFYEVTADDTPNYKVQELYGTFKTLFSFPYSSNGEIAGSTGPIKINWTSGANNASTYFSTGQGCGSTGYVVAKNVNTSQLIKVGTTPHGQTVYQLPGSNALVQETYTKDYDSGQYLDNKSLQNLSVDQFSKQHAYFLAKNGLGEYVMFLRDDMIVHGGCAKPVVYLYPQQKQQVSVKVGAQVVNSDPGYGSGWDDVTAYPDGSLAYNGKVYGSLFWDGYGYGTYPQVDSGSIVKTPLAVATVRSQLRQQGLNSQEITDFLNYWQPKLQAVKQPYTRLTWFNTAQMNRLAPLQVTPRPQTLIRVFLDFQGLNKPYSLKPQHLYALQRNGFTVVEWGGLARNGLND